MRHTTKIIILSTALISFLSIGSLLQASNNEGENAVEKSETVTTVVNLSNDEYDEYIGRGRKQYTHMMTEGIKPGEEGWMGNPHPIGLCERCSEHHTRDECIVAFKKDFGSKIKSDSLFQNQVIALRGKRLGCYCKPEACHGDVIKAWLDSVEND